MNRGKIVIVMMLVVGVGLASFAWWHRWRRSRAVLTSWGSQAADAIRNGEKVDLFRIGPARQGRGTNAEEITVGTQRYLLFDRRDITNSAGLIHARHHLLHEQGFAWHAGDAEIEPTWDFVLRFTKGQSVATMALDFSGQRARLLERDREVSMAPISAALQAFILDIMSTDASGTAIPEEDRE